MNEDRIIHRLLRNGWKVKYPDGRSDAVREAARSVPVVTCDEIYELNLKTSDFGLRPGDYGPFRLPFPLMWVEARSARGVGVGGRMLPSVAQSWLLEQRGNHVRCAAALVSVSGGPIIAMPCVWTGRVDEQGMFLGDWHMQFDGSVLRPDSGGELANELNVPMMAVGFMNCKNVRIETEPPPEARTGRKAKADARRQYAPCAKIIVPGISAVTTRGDLRGITVKSDATPHVVRGHFKTYTDENPLFGSKTGTYWWSHHVRSGDEAKPKEYVVKSRESVQC